MNRFTRLRVGRRRLAAGLCALLLGAALLAGAHGAGAFAGSAVSRLAATPGSVSVATSTASSAASSTAPGRGGRPDPSNATTGDLELIGDAQRSARLLRVVGALERNGRALDVPPLLPLLHEADAALRDAAEAAIWAMWSRSSDPQVDVLYRTGVRLLARRDLANAERVFTRVIERLPAFAEAWNKRATVRFLRDDLVGALADSHEVIARIPDHFGALAGIGHIWFRRDDQARALAWWRRSLAVNPAFDSVRRSIEAVESKRPGYGRIVT